uniref:Ovule protein n=1 Tax=Steinernema glaseri TaxID=37863 RepID=A0A1I8A4Y0_9BILA
MRTIMQSKQYLFDRTVETRGCVKRSAVRLPSKHNNTIHSLFKPSSSRLSLLKVDAQIGVATATTSTVR